MLKYFRKRLDDFLGILERICSTTTSPSASGPRVADFSMMAYLHYPADETGYDFAVSHPAVHAWLGRIARPAGLALGL